MHFRAVLFILFVLVFSKLKGQVYSFEGKYTYLNQANKNFGMANGSVIELQKDSVVIMNTNYHIGGVRTYKGKWCFRRNSIRIFNLHDINGVQPLNRQINIETIKSNLAKDIRLVISDDGKFTDYFPAEITINNKTKYFLKSNDTLVIKNRQVTKIEVKVEDYIEFVKVAIHEPTLIKVAVKNNTQGTLYYYFKDIFLRIKRNNQLYYKGIELIK